MKIWTTKQFLMCKLNEKFVGNPDPNFSDDFILELISSELQVEDLIEIMEDYAQLYHNSKMGLIEG